MPLYAFTTRDSQTLDPIPGAHVTLYRNTNFTDVIEGGVTDQWGHLHIDTGMGIARAYTILAAGYIRVASTTIADVNPVRMVSEAAGYTVTFSAGSGGSVSPEGTQTVAVDSTITATATPYSGYVFRAWVVDGEDYDTRSPFTFPIGHDGMTIQATFEDEGAARYTVTFSAGSGGSVSPKGTQTVAADSTITATATPYSGYVFRAWVVDGEDYGTRSPFTFSIGRDGMNIVATFEGSGDGDGGGVVTAAVSSGIPWPFTWIGDVVNWFGQAWEGIETARQQASEVLNRAVTDSLDATAKQMVMVNELLQEQTEANKGLGGLIWGGLSDSMKGLVQNSMAEALAEVTRLLPDATGHSPETKKAMDAVLEPYANGIVAAILAEVNPAKYAHSPITPEEAKNSLNLMLGGIVAVEIGLFTAHVFLEGATLGQVEALSQLENMVVSKLGLNQIASSAVTIPLTELVLKRAQQYYAAEYTPEIPSYQDLIEMVVKEVIPLADFKAQMKYLGYAEDWSQKIWDKHFIPPSLTDILTAWRRGLIDEKRVDELMILVDLDPRFKAIFDTRKYVTPTLSLARFMFETGAINAAKVEEIIKLEGYAPEFVPSLVDYIVGFQGRRWRTRYLQALATGFVRGIRTEAEIRRAVLDAGYTEEVATWLIEASKVRRDLEKTKDVTEVPKLIGVGDLKRAYVRNLIDADKLRMDLQMRGYQTTDVDLLVKLLDEEKVVTSAGGEKVALSVPELMNAWRYQEITEDRVRIELQLRGLSLEEVNILINTKKKQWSIGVSGE